MIESLHRLSRNRLNGDFLNNILNFCIVRFGGGEPTFAGAPFSDEDTPPAAVHEATMKPPEATLKESFRPRRLIGGSTKKHTFAPHFYA